MSEYGAPIPPYERPDGADTRGSNTGQPQPLPASNDDLRALLEEQRAEIGKLRSRSRWILVIACIAALNSCNASSDRSSGPDESTSAQLRQSQESVNQLTDEVRQLQQHVSDLSERLPSANRTG